MKYGIITVAGMSERFNKGYDNPILKCIYYEQDEKKTLLYSILKKCKGLDKVIIVGGYQYEKLVEYIDKYKEHFEFGIQLVFNSEYQHYGSGYSLYCGLKVCYEEDDCSEIIFIEGDLYFDEETFEQIKKSNQDVITVNCEPICSNKSVALYINEDNKIKYIYNTHHGLFRISESFSEIYNSGQVWKLKNNNLFRMTFSELDELGWQSTNLIFLEKYFNCIDHGKIVFMFFKKWTNCNTRKDYSELKD